MPPVEGQHGSTSVAPEQSFVTKYCRMCALELKSGVFIFGEEGKRLHISEKIRKTLAILVLEEDSLPKRICTDCCSSLEDYAHYKDTVLDAQEKLANVARLMEKSSNASQNDTRSDNLSNEITYTGHDDRRTDHSDAPTSRAVSGCISTNSKISNVTFRCGRCESNSEVFTDNQAWKSHERRFHPEFRKCPLYKCVKCPTLFSSLSAFAEHLCLDSSENSPSKSLYHKRKFRKAIPNNETEAPTPLEIRENSYSCKDCGKRFLTPTGLKGHVLTKHLSTKATERYTATITSSCVNEDLECSFSASESAVSPGSPVLDDQAFEQEPHSDVLRNSPPPIANGSRPDVSSSSVRSYEENEPASNAESRTPKSPENLKCTICDKSFRSSPGYHNHMMGHSGRRFRCEECNATYMQKASLIHHKKVHHSRGLLKKFACGNCSQMFHERKHLNEHLKIHSLPSDAYKCQVCGKKFKTGRCLRRHAKLHSSTKKYECSTCGKGFHARIKLQEHENSHVGKKPLGCPFCEKSFSCYPNYSKHLKRKHGEEVSNSKLPPPRKEDLTATKRSQPPVEVPSQLVTTSPVYNVSANPPILNSHRSDTLNCYVQNSGFPSNPPAPAHIPELTHTLTPCLAKYNNTSASGPMCGTLQSTVNAMDLVDCAIQSALAEQNNGVPSGHHDYNGHSLTSAAQNEPMELSYKLESHHGFQDMPMELTKVFQRDPLELCVRQDFNQLVDLSLRDQSTMPSTSIATSSAQKFDFNDRESLALSKFSFVDLGAFRQPIDLISRADGAPSDMCSEGNLVDLSQRSGFGQDQSASSFLREWIDLSSRSDTFGGELDLTKPNHSSQAHQSHMAHVMHHPNSNSQIAQAHSSNMPKSVVPQTMAYQDAVFNL